MMLVELIVWQNVNVKTNGIGRVAMITAHRKPKGARMTLFVWRNARTFAICAAVKTNGPKRNARNAMPKSARRRGVRRSVRKLAIYAIR